MQTIERSIEVAVPVEDAYSQWTQLEEFSRFMPSVERVERLGDRHSRWEVRMAGFKEGWVATVTEEIPDKRIAWKAASGARHAGCVTLHRLSEVDCRVLVQIDYRTRGMTEGFADSLGLIDRAVARALEGFKHFLERRLVPTGRDAQRVPESEESPPPARSAP